MTDHLWHQHDPMQARGPSGAGRTSAGWFALALVLVWSAAMALALSVANSVSAADLASTAVPRCRGIRWTTLPYRSREQSSSSGSSA